MEYLTTAEVLLIHARVIQRIEGTSGIRDVGLLESALARPRATFDQNELYPDLWHQAAALMHSLIKNHPFVDGNKRTALVATGVFLEVNGHRLVASNQAAFDFTLGVAIGDLELGEMAQWLARNSRPVGD